MIKFKSLIKSHPLVLVDFYADWCGPCKTMAPELNKLKKEFGDDVKIAKINTEKNKLLASQFNIRSIPTLMLYKDGKLVHQQAGAVMFPGLKELVNHYK